jgi:hypothetical protein
MQKLGCNVIMMSPEGNPKRVEISPALREVLDKIVAEDDNTVTPGLKKAILSKKYHTRPLMPGEVIEGPEQE